MSGTDMRRSGGKFIGGIIFIWFEGSKGLLMWFSLSFGLGGGWSHVKDAMLPGSLDRGGGSLEPRDLGNLC